MAKSRSRKSKSVKRRSKSGCRVCRPGRMCVSCKSRSRRRSSSRRRRSSSRRRRTKKVKRGGSPASERLMSLLQGGNKSNKCGGCGHKL